MLCPFCSSDKLSVIDSRDADAGGATRRRRVCDHCERRFTTYERPEGVDLNVIKKSGEKECFDREKIKRGLIKATWKRPVSLSQIEALVSEVEAKLRARDVHEIKTWEIGNLVISRLKKIDPLAYLLFASVYRDFEDLKDFQQEVDALLKTEK